MNSAQHPLRVAISGAGSVTAAYAAWLLAGAGAEVRLLSANDSDRNSPVLDWLTGSLSRGSAGGARRPSDLSDDCDVLIADAGDRLTDGWLLQLRNLLVQHPRLVIVAISPYGATGGWRARRATAHEIQAASGLLNRTGYREDPPTPVGGDVIEMATGANAALAGLLALRQSRAQGRGQLVEVSALETAIGLQSSGAINYAQTGLVQRRPSRNGRGLQQFLRCRDGLIHLHVSVVAWDHFLRYLGLSADDLPLDARALTGQQLHSHPGVVEAVERALQQRTVAEWVQEGQAWRIPAVPVNTPAHLLDDEDLCERAYFQEQRICGEQLRAPRTPLIDLRDALAQAGADPNAHEAPKDASDGLALGGLRVLEIGLAWSAPVAGELLAMHGAEVIRVEPPSRADTARIPPLLGLRPRARWYDYSANYQGVNAGKRHLAFDLTSPYGEEVRRRLLSWADIVLTNYSPRALKNLKLDGAAIAEVNPRCITVHSTGFSFTGRYAHWMIYGPGMEGLCGIAALTGGSGPPIGSPLLHPDIFSSLHQALSTVIALLKRETTGRGSVVDLAQFEVGALAVAGAILDEQLPAGSKSTPSTASLLLPCSGDDEWVALTLAGASEWRSLCDLAGLSTSSSPTWEQILADPAAATTQLGSWTRCREKGALANELQALALAAAPVLRVDEVQTLPHLRERDYFLNVKHAPFGTQRSIGRWQHIPESLIANMDGVHTFGEDNAAILTESLGFTAAEVAAMARTHAIADGPTNVVGDVASSAPVEWLLAQQLIYRHDADYRLKLGLPADEE